MLNSMIASVCRDFIGAAGVVLLLFSGIVLGQSSEYSVGALSPEDQKTFYQCIAGLEHLENCYTHAIIRCRTTRENFNDDSLPLGDISRDEVFMANGRDRLRVDRTGFADDENYDDKFFVNPQRYVLGTRYDADGKYIVDDVSEEIRNGVSIVTISRFAFAPFGFWVLPIRDCFIDTAETHYRWQVLKINETTIDGEPVVEWDAKVSDQMEGKLRFYKSKGYALKSYYICIKNEKLEKKKEIFFDCGYDGTLKHEGVTVPKIKRCEYLCEILGQKARTVEHTVFDVLEVTPQMIPLDEFDPEKVMGVKIGKSPNYFWLRLTTGVLGLVFIFIWLYLSTRKKIDD
jgi:hypothetical protein